MSSTIVAGSVVSALAVAVALDLTVSEPPSRFHPVAWFGSVISAFDRPWARPRLVGVAVALGLPLVIAGLVGVTVAVAVGVHPVLGILTAGISLFTVVSLRMLLDVTTEVVDRTETEPTAARESVRALVGRDASALSPAHLRSAAVESAAENLSDGFVAPLAGFAAGATVGLATGNGEGALPLGAAAAVWVKVVNTLDSMLGYPSKPLGWASARLDDAVMFLPARASAVCLAAASGSIAPLRRARSWARTPASPNSGWPMATTAAALDVRLEKPGNYVLNPNAESPDVDDGHAAVRLVGVAGGVAVAVTAGWLLAIGGVIAWS